MKAAVLATVVGLVCGFAVAFPGKDGQLSIEIPEPIVEDIAYEPEPPEDLSQKEGLKIAVPIESESNEKVSYAGSQLWRAVVDTTDKLRLISQLKENSEISTWGGNRSVIDIFVQEKNRDLLRKTLRRNLVNFEVVIDDVQKAIDEENPTEDEEDEDLENRQAKRLNYWAAWRGLTAPGNRLDLWPHANWGHRLTFTSYHRVSDIHGYLDYLAQTYPSLCKIYVIGSSHQGRPLKVLRISNGKPGNKAVWVDGGIHAREWITSATVAYIINSLVLNFDAEPKEIQNIDWYFLPVANPDGYEYSHTTNRLWRKNRARIGQCIGTDLNRNYGYQWGGRGSGRNPCQDTYGGSQAFSEPETAAIRDFITRTSGANWKASISYHSYGQYILYPWGYAEVVPPDHHDLQKVGLKAAEAMRSVGGASYSVGPAALTLYPAAGGSDDWAKGAANMKYTYTIELRDTGRYGFILPASYIQPTAKEGLAALRVIGQAAAAA